MQLKINHSHLYSSINCINFVVESSAMVGCMTQIDKNRLYVLVADVTHMPRQIAKQSSQFYVVAVVFIGQTFLAI